MSSRPRTLLVLGAVATSTLIALQVISLAATIERFDEDRSTRIRAALERVRQRVDPGDDLTIRLERVLTPEGFSEGEFQLVVETLTRKLAEEYARQGLAPNPDVRLWNPAANDARIPSDGDLVTHSTILSRNPFGEGCLFGVVHPQGTGLARLMELPVLGSLSLALTLAIFVLCAAALRVARGIEERAARQRAFVENFTHELRTPVFALSVAVKTLAADPCFDSENQPMIARVANSARRVSAHVERLAQLVSLEHASSAADVRVELHGLIESVAPAYRVRAEAAGGEVSLELKAQHPSVMGDPDAWRSVLENLLDNALRYSGDDPMIQVTTETRGNELELLVEDRGPGVPPAQSARIFERYTRASEGTVHNTKGLGLGLAIAREVVRAAGGSIECEPRAGGGATFRVRVPHAIAAESAHDA